MQKSIPTSKVEVFEEKLAKLNKKQEKYGLPLTTAVKIGEHTEVMEFRTHEKGESFRDDAVSKKRVRFVDYEITNLKLVRKEEGLEYLGSRVLKDEVPVVYCVRDEFLDIVSAPVDVCDHCHTQRKRNKYHVFKKQDGSIVRVGSTCCKDYFGYDVDQFLSCYLETFSVWSDGEDDEDWVSHSMVFDWNDLYHHTKQMTDNFTEWNDDIMDFDVECTTDDYSERVGEIKNHWETQSGSFAFNCRSIMNCQLVSIKNLKLAFAALYFGNRDVCREKERKAKEVEQPSHVEGEKVRIAGTVEKVLSVETIYGITFMILINCNGVFYKMFTKNREMTKLEVGDEVEVEAVFKKVDVFNNFINQLVTKPKLVSKKEREVKQYNDEAEKALDNFLQFCNESN